MLLCLYRKRWCASLTLDCFIANLFSGLTMDLLFGTMATLIAAIAMHSLKKPLLASLIPAVVNGIVIGAELYFFADLPFWFSALSVAAGAIVAVTLVGLPLLHAASRSERFCMLVGIPAARAEEIHTNA